MKLNPVDFSPADMFRQCAGEMQILSQEKGLELHLELDGISQPFFESVVFMDGVACGDAVFSAIEMNLSSEQNNNNRNIGTGWQ